MPIKYLFELKKGCICFPICLSSGTAADKTLASPAFFMHLTRHHGLHDPTIQVILDGGVEVPGEIVNVSRGGMNIHLPIRLANGTVLNFRVPGCDCGAKGQVLYCRPDAYQFFIALSILDTPNRRREPRLGANQPITLSVVSGEGSNKLQGRLIDVSHSGLGVIVKSAVVLGALVEVRADGGVVYGEVRNCTKAPDGGFRIGILIEEGFAGEWLSAK